MSIRLKVFFIIVGIILVITASSVVISIMSAQDHVLKTLESDMELVSSLANEFISGEIDLLKANAANVAHVIKSTRIEEMQKALIEQVASQEHFTAITIFNESGKVEAWYGSSPAPEIIAMSEYGQQAFRGFRDISSTFREASGLVVFYVLVPLDDDYYYQTIIGEEIQHPKIVVCTVPGDFFSHRVSRFLIWETGTIIMGDEEGTIIANVYQEWVNARLNFIEQSKKDAQYTDVSRVIKRMIAGESGTDRYSLDGADSVIAFRPITATAQGWSIAVIAPIAESPFYKVRISIAISGLVFLALGLIAAILASGIIAKPFNRIKAQNIELVRLGEAAKVASKAKTDFLANMSNEMTIPINRIIGLAEMSLKKEGLQKDVATCLEKIYGSGMTLQEVVNNLLDISNMESNKFELVCGNYDVPKCINDLANANMIHIGPKPINFNLVLDKNIPVKLNGDELRVKQIFNNLLSNAFTYTKEGTVEWRISTERDGDSVWLISTITDTGAGIKPEDIGSLFIEYKNLSTRKEFNREGTGLGLALTKRMVDLMDGTIAVESIVGRGSTFTVRIRQHFVSETVISDETAENLKKFKYVIKK